jgi:TrmH family RNA methyltransferase
MEREAEIRSAHNPLLKEVRRALERGALTREGLCAAEGFHLLEEALRSGLRVAAVLCAAEARPKVDALLGAAPTRVVAVKRELLERISAAETSQGVIALVRPPQWDAGQLFGRPGPVVVLDRLQDPGNAGAVARAAEAFGAAGLVWMKGTVSRWNAKTLRASAGSLFRLPCVEAEDAETARAMLEERGRRILVAEARDGMAPWEADWRAPCALVIGNEARGPQPEFSRAGRAVHVPTAGVESLNAAVAAAVLLYEAWRQREPV